MSICSHITELFVPTFTTAVHKEECCTCFNTQDPELNGSYSPDVLSVSSLSSTKLNYPKQGHNVCLTCFTGGCFTPRGHMFHHHEVSKHHVVLNIVKYIDHYQSIEIDPNTVQSLSDLAQNVQSQQQKQPKYEYTAYCITCDATHVIDPLNTPTLHASLQYVLNSDNATTLIEASHDDGLNLSAFDEKPTPCPHTSLLEDEQMEHGAINISLAFSGDNEGNTDTNTNTTREDDQMSIVTSTGHTLYLHENGLPDLSKATKPPTDDEFTTLVTTPPSHNIYKCQDCDIHTNLWLCMTCGYLGCARRDYDGSGGNNHAVEHSETTGHPLVVKIATVTKDTGDIWCYSCSKSVVDPDLSTHLAAFNVDTSSLHQTEMNLAEMQLQMNITAQFATAYNEDGLIQPLVFGHGYTGIQNRGNSCYLSSVLQCMMRIPLWKERYWSLGVDHVKTCRNNRPGQCYLCNMYKLADGLFSATYSAYPSSNGLLAFMSSQGKKIAESQQQLGKPLNGKKNHLQEGHTEDDSVDSRKKQRITSSDTNMNDNDVTVQMDSSSPSSPSPSTDPSVTSPADPTTTVAVTPSVDLQHGVSIHSTRKLFCDKHPVFGNNLQQCAYEFLCHFRDKVKTIEKGLPSAQQFKSHLIPNATSLIDPFAFKTFTLKQCSTCNHISSNISLQYDLGLNFLPSPSSPDPEKPICNFSTCLDLFAQPNTLEGYKCPQCSAYSTTTSQTTILTQPQYLVVQLKRFIIDTTTWSIAKSNVSIQNVSEISLSSVLTPTDIMGLSTPEEAAQVDDPQLKETIEMMHEMLQAPRCLIRQLLAKCGGDPNVATELIFTQDAIDHTDDCTCPDGPNAAATPSAASSTETASKQTNPAMESACALDLHATNGHANYKLVSFINHLGTNTNNGHYVSHILSTFNHHGDNDHRVNPLTSANPPPQQPVQFAPLKINNDLPLTVDNIEQSCISPLPTTEQQWVCFNDNKVFINDKPPHDQAYVYIFERQN